MSWTATFGDPGELRSAFGGAPPARFRPVPIWWWSGETLDEDRLAWQLERIAELGCGGWAVTGLALHGPAVGTRPDDPPGFSPEWLGLYRKMCERSRELGLGVVAWSPLQIGGAPDAHLVLAEHPELRGELVRSAGAQPESFGLDYGNPEAVAALVAPGTRAGAYLASIEDLLGDVIVGMFEDEFPLMPPWSPGFAEDFLALKGYEVPVGALFEDAGPRTPAMRFDVYDVAATRARRAYTAYLARWCERYDLLAGFDEMNRSGDPLMSSLCYFDPFKVLSWASAPGSDQMGDVRFAMSMADAFGAPRVWLEGFHSHGWGLTLARQMRLLAEWCREGATLFMPHGFYYTTRAFWWEWAPPEMGWRQPYARHYPAFAEAVGRLTMLLSAGRHRPEVAVLYPTSTVWAGTLGHRSWSAEAEAAARCYTELFGVHDEPSARHPERARIPSLLAEAGYDRVAVDEAHARDPELPIVLPGCICLETETLRELVAQAGAGRLVVVVEPVPAWSAELGREDEAFLDLAKALRDVAVVVATAEDALAVLPPPRAEGMKTLWRQVGDLDVVCATGAGTLRLRGLSSRRPERWDLRTGRVEPFAARVDGGDLVMELADPVTVLSLPPGEPLAPLPAPPTSELELPAVWECEYLPWGENRWGDYLLPPNEGTPPVERRTFAFREGDDPSWRSAPVVPEDVEHAHVDVGFEERMRGVSGRPVPADRWLADGWREVVSTYGPKAVVDGTRLAEYSERLGVEDLALTTQIGLKGWVEPVKVDLGPGGSGVVVSYGRVAQECETHLVVEGAGVLTVALDGDVVVGPVEGGVLAVPVRLSAGWHEVAITVSPRPVSDGPLSAYLPATRTRLAWVFAEPYTRDPVSIWGGPLLHPDYKGSPGPRLFRRRVVLPEPGRLSVRADGSGPVSFEAPEILGEGEHVIELSTVGGDGTPQFWCTVEIEMASATLRLASDGWWETATPGGPWEGAFPMGSVTAPPAELGPPVARRHPLTDVAWLEGEQALLGQVAQLWSDATVPPPPAWFCFTAPPGALSMDLPVVGEVEAWLDGEPAETAGRRLRLREGARVALRVEAPTGFRGAACFTRHPRLELGTGSIAVGRSWHLQGLDCFSGVVLHRCEVRAERATEGLLELGEVAGSVGVRVNGEPAGTLAWEPWSLPVPLRAGVNVIELEVANTLGPLCSRGIPTTFGPEDQRVSGLLGRPRIVLARDREDATC